MLNLLRPDLLTWKALLWLWHHKRISIAVITILMLGWIFYPKPKPAVATQTITRQTFTQTLSISGTVVAKNQVNLTFPTSGKLAWIGVKKGDTVAAGQTIATLDQRTVLKNLENSLRSYSIARNAFDTTQDQYGDTAPQNAGTTAIQRILQDNQYNLDQAVISVELQDLARQQAILTTPIAGIITRADAEIAGPDAIAGSTTFTVTDPTSLVFHAEVDQADIGKVVKDMPVKIVFDAYPDTTLTEKVGTIDFVSHTTTNGSEAYNVETQLPINVSGKYRVGMNGNADIVLSQEDNVLTVPLSSIENDTYVWLKVKNGFRKQKVKLGAENDTDALVISGLSENDKVALDPTQAEKQAVK